MALGRALSLFVMLAAIVGVSVGSRSLYIVL